MVLAGESYDEAHTHARKLEAEQGLTFVHPFDDPDVIAGQSTIGVEICVSIRSRSTSFSSASAAAGSIAGVAAYIKRLRPEHADHRRLGASDSDAMARSLAAGKRVQLDTVGSFADGAAVKLVGEETFRLAQLYVDEMVLVDTDAICAAIKDVFEDTRSILEPAGALAVAGAKAWVAKNNVRGATRAAIASGANMNFIACASSRNGPRSANRAKPCWR